MEKLPKEIFVTAIVAGTVVPTMIVGTAVPTRVVGTAAKEIFVPAIIVGTIVPTRIVGAAVPSIIVETAYYWKSCHRTGGDLSLQQGYCLRRALNFIFPL